MPPFQIAEKHLPGGTLDPDIKALLEEMKANNVPSFEELSIAEAREAARESSETLSGTKETVHQIYDTKIDLDDGGSIPVRVYIPNEGGNLPALVYYHGGGWVICDLDTHDNICRTLCKEAECVVVSVHYRHAPEYKFPTAVIDANTALKWVASQCSNLNIDRNRIAVGGDSAGGNLAAVVSILNRDEGRIPICFQLLVYPVTDLSYMDNQSYNHYETGYFLSKPMMEWFKGLYLKDDQDAYSTMASPLLAGDLSHLPPALVITAEFDPLRDEGELYARKLHDAGVNVQCTRYNGMLHPFWGMASVTSQATEAHLEAASSLKSVFYK